MFNCKKKRKITKTTGPKLSFAIFPFHAETNEIFFTISTI